MTVVIIIVPVVVSFKPVLSAEFLNINVYFGRYKYSVMSARVFNPMAMSEFKRLIGRSNNGRDPNGQLDDGSIKRIRKTLFGPVDHEYNIAFVERELAASNVRDSEKWGFDFVREKPLNSGASRFVWERVLPERDTVPEAYALRRLPYLHAHADADADADSTTCSLKRKSPVKSVSRLKKPTTRSKQSRITEFLKSRKRNSPKAIGVGASHKLRSHSLASPKKRNIAPRSS